MIHTTSEKHEGKSMDTSNGKKPCFGSIKQPDGFNVSNSEASVKREISAACGDESLVLNKSTYRFTESPSKDNFGNQSEHRVTKTNLNRPLMTYQCYKGKSV